LTTLDPTALRLDDSAAEAAVAATTIEARLDIAPAFKLLLAADARGIFQVMREAGHLPPFWAFAWPGGQVLARYILDNPALVAGRSVLDIGAGSGVIALAAAHAGARRVIASDIDPLSVAAIRLNARLNGFDIEVTDADLLDGDAGVDVVLAGDVCYESPLTERVEAFFARARKAGAEALVADRSRMPASAAFRRLVEYDTVVAPPLQYDYVEPATVWQAH